MYTPTSTPSRLLSYTRYPHRVSAVEYGHIACVSPYPTHSICAPFPIRPASVLYPLRLCLVPGFYFVLRVLRFADVSSVGCYIAPWLTLQ